MKHKNNPYTVLDYYDILPLIPAEIEVRITEDSMGNVNIFPIETTIQQLISATNQYDGSYDIYLQNSQDIEQFLSDYPKSRYKVSKDDNAYKIGKYYYQVNDNNIFMIDSWEYRHMVGGQSD